MPYVPIVYYHVALRELRVIRPSLTNGYRLLAIWENLFYSLYCYDLDQSRLLAKV